MSSFAFSNRSFKSFYRVSDNEGMISSSGYWIRSTQKGVCLWCDGVAKATVFPSLRLFLINAPFPPFFPSRIEHENLGKIFSDNRNEHLSSPPKTNNSQQRTLFVCWPLHWKPSNAHQLPTMATAASSSTSNHRQRRNFVDSGSYGSPPKSILSEEQSLKVRFYDFADLMEQRGQWVDSSTMKAHGLSWKLRIYPRGDSNSNLSAIFVSCYLVCVDVEQGQTKEVKTKFQFESSSGQHQKTWSSGEQTFTKLLHTRGWPDFFLRNDSLSQFLDKEGTLEIDIHIQVYLDKKFGQVWYPKLPPHEKAFNAGKLLQSKIGADVIFSVGYDRTKFHVHKAILYHRAKEMYDLVERFALVEECELRDISAAAFKILLDYIYTGNLPRLDEETDDSEVAKELILVSNRFSCILLKLHVESEITSKLVNTNNVAEWLLLADGHSCPLLKEKCMEIYKQNPIKVMGSPSWKNIEESNSLLKELLKFSAVATTTTMESFEDYADMDVRTLRETLECLNLDLDGTREMLIKRLRLQNNHQLESFVMIDASRQEE